MVYAIAQLWIHDAATYGRYVEQFMEVFRKYKGRVLVADESPVVLEGAWDGTKVVVLSFPDTCGVVARMGGVAGVPGNRAGPQGWREIGGS